MSEQQQQPFKRGRCLFAFDLVCPFAFIASERIDDIARFTGAEVIWTPVLLGGLYDLTNAPQGKDGSAMDVVAENKKKLLQEDFQRELKRYQLKLSPHPQHPVKTVDAGRLLCAFPQEYRPLLAHALFRAYWLEGANISSRATLLRIARSLKLTSVAAPTHSGPFSMSPALPFALDESVFSDTKWADQLRENTEFFHSKGAFGVPSFWIEERQKLFFGQDRLHLVEAELISIKVSKPLERVRQLERLLPRCLRTPPEDRKRTLRFWFDFSSPWAYLGWSQLERLQRECGPGLTIEYKPFLLGALFRSIGTPMVPMEKLIDEKKRYMMQDLHDWSNYWGAVNQQDYPPIPAPKLRWPDEFPINSVTALRVALLDSKTIGPIYYAAWRDNKRISDPKVLAEVLDQAGFSGSRMVAEVTAGSRASAVKEALRSNTKEAEELGLCGAPTYQLGTAMNTIIWGQDRVHVVQDRLLGWNSTTSTLRATVAGFPRFNYLLPKM